MEGGRSRQSDAVYTSEKPPACILWVHFTLSYRGGGQHWQFTGALSHARHVMSCIH